MPLAFCCSDELAEGILWRKGGGKQTYKFPEDVDTKPDPRCQHCGLFVVFFTRKVGFAKLFTYYRIIVVLHTDGLFVRNASNTGKPSDASEHQTVGNCNGRVCILDFVFMAHFFSDKARVLRALGETTPWRTRPDQDWWEAGNHHCDHV